MKNRIRIIFPVILLSLVVSSPALAVEKKSSLDSCIESAQKAFDEGKYLRAERSFIRASKELSKNTADERLAKVMCSLGDCYIKEGKYTNAEDSFKQSLDILRGLSLDQTDILGRLKQLGNLYRPIKFEAIDDNAVAFANQVGAISASAENKDDKHHIDINLKDRFQQGIEELIDGAPKGAIPLDKPGSSSTDASTSAAAASSTASATNGNGADSSTSTGTDAGKKPDSPQVKKLRLDKKITFDLVRQGDDGKVTIANIQGISLDVGLWVKLKQFAMQLNENNKPVADVTAGAFGVEKVVRIDLPGKLYDKLKEGLAKFDPFWMLQPAAAAEAPGEKPGTATSTASPAMSGSNSNSATGLKEAAQK